MPSSLGSEPSEDDSLVVTAAAAQAACSIALYSLQLAVAVKKAIQRVLNIFVAV